MAKKPSREVVGKLTFGIVFLYEVYKVCKVIPMQLHHIRFAEAFAKLSQVRPRTNLFHYFFGFCIEFFVATRIVANDIYPRRAVLPSRTDQGTVVLVWGKSHLDERVGQL